VTKAQRHKVGKARPKISAFSLQSSAFSSGFTLIELLVVISIIAILAGMVLPMFYSAKERAREAKAQVAVKALETAFKSYLDTYKVWPADPAFPNGEISDDIFKTLRGEDPVAGYNPQKIAFYEFGSTNSTDTKAYDPWLNVYQVMFDKNYDNQITVPASVGGGEVYRCVVVWTFDKDSNVVASWK